MTNWYVSDALGATVIIFPKLPRAPSVSYTKARTGANAHDNPLGTVVVTSFRLYRMNSAFATLGFLHSFQCNHWSRINCITENSIVSIVI